MRKIIICMLFFATNVFAETISNYSDAWKVGIPYNKTVSEETVIKNYGSFATVLIAREIYENGARFCPTRVMGSDTSYGNITLRYQDNPLFTCYTICKPGFHGNTCEKTGTPSICGNTNYESVLKDKLKIDTKSDVSLSSYNISAFNTGSETSGYGLSQVEAYQSTTLGIIGYVPYGVVVAPIKISTTAGVISSISVSTNGQTTHLCASGYKFENGECVKPDNCRTIVIHHGSNNEPAGGKDFCQGYQYYDKTKHSLVDGSSCYSYVCKEGGFDQRYGHQDCIEDCGKTKQSGVLDNGDCKICGDNQMFNGERCVDYQSLAARDLVKGIQGLFDCWREVGSAAYKECVTCPGGWEKNEKRCYP